MHFETKRRVSMPYWLQTLLFFFDSRLDGRVIQLSSRRGKVQVQRTLSSNNISFKFWCWHKSSKFKVHSISPNKEHEDIQYRLHIYKVGIYKHTESKYTKCISVPMSMVAVGNTPQTGYPSDHDTEGSTPQYPKLQHSPQSACSLVTSRKKRSSSGWSRD